jgi:1A family penicillin-binding protein
MNIKKITERVVSYFKKDWGWFRKKFGKWFGPLLFFAKYLLYLIGIGFIFLCLVFLYYAWNLPQPEDFTQTPFIQSTKIYDRTGKVLLYDIYGEQKREVVPFDQISDNLKHSVIASEDQRFYQHGGIDLQGIARAVFIDVTGGGVTQGGSTITQQLVRAVYLTDQRSLARKIKEIILSIELESHYSKDQIFDWYLNEIPFGQNAYGAEAAAQTYFGEPASDLTVAQSAVLTALIPAPSYYSPYGPNKQALLDRKNIVLEKMESQGYITADQLKASEAEPITFNTDTQAIKAPDFVFYVEKYLDTTYGEDYLKEKGLRVYTTLDWTLQQTVEQTLKDNEKALAAKNAYNAASVVIDPTTGEILALAGSKDYFADPYPAGCNDTTGNTCLFDPQYDVATMGQRQPGSSFKPFVYATAFEKGYTPNTVLWDVKTEFNPNCSSDASQTNGLYGSVCYHPSDYDDNNRGPVTMRQSIAGSLNIPSVETLYLAGIPDSLATAKSMGITTLTDTNNYGLSLVLGGGDVNLLQMVSAYGVFATEGSYIPAVSILKITDASGNVLEQNTATSTKVMNTQTTREISSVLSDNQARSFIFGANSPLYLPDHKNQVAVKTGTTENFVDGWTMGYSDSVVTGVWVGNNNNKPTRDEGVGTAAPIWHTIMEKALSLYPPSGTFTPPDPVTNEPAALLGTLAPGDPNTILYYVNKDDPLGPPPANPSADPEYNNWQNAINNWLGLQTPNPSTLPTTTPDSILPAPTTNP